MGKKAMKKPSRLTADPCLSVADLVKIFENWLTMSLSKDIYSLLAPSDGKPFSWKTTPNHKWLAQVAPLYILLVKVVPNTVITSKKMLMVIESLKAKQVITNSSKMPDALFCDWVDQTVRILFAKFREVKRDPVLLERINKKCSADEWRVIDQVLKQVLAGDDVSTEDTQSHVTLSPPKSWGSWTSAVNVLVQKEHGPQPSECKPECSILSCNVGIFNKVLQGSKDTEEESGAPHTATSTNHSWKMIEHTPEMPETQEQPPSPDCFSHA